MNALAPAVRQIRVLQPPPRLVAKACGDAWLVIQREAVRGDVTWAVIDEYASRAAAEAAAGLHHSPVMSWMVRHPELGWRLMSQCGWTENPAIAGRWDETVARRITSEDVHLDLMVLRLNGMVTCPDLVGEASL